MIRDYIKSISLLLIYALVSISILLSLNCFSLLHAQEARADDSSEVNNQFQHQSNASLLVSGLHLNSLHDHFYSGLKFSQLWTKCSSTSNSSVVDPSMCAVFSVSRYFNFININDYLSLGIHLGLSSIREINSHNSSQLFWNGQAKLYAGIQGLIDNDSMFLGLKLTNHTNYTGIFSMISDTVTTGQIIPYQNWTLILSSGLNLLRDSDRFFGPTLSIISYDINLNNNPLRYENSNFQLGLLYANSTHTDNSTWLGFYRAYINAELKQVPVMGIINAIKSINSHTENLHINFGGDWIIQTKLADLMLGIGYNSALSEYQNIKTNLLQNLNLKAGFILRLF